MVAERDERETLSNIEGLRIISSCGILFDHFGRVPPRGVGAVGK